MAYIVVLGLSNVHEHMHTYTDTHMPYSQCTCTVCTLCMYMYIMVSDILDYTHTFYGHTHKPHYLVDQGLVGKQMLTACST